MADGPVERMRSPEAMRHQKHAFVVERIGWALMVLFVLAALLGLLGSGPLSRSRVSTPDGALDVTYQRFLRQDSTTSLQMQLEVEPGQSPGVALDTTYLSAFQLQRVQPQPQEVIPRGEQTQFVFAAPDEVSTISVTFELRAMQFGIRSGSVQLPGAGRVTFRQYVYP